MSSNFSVLVPIHPSCIPGVRIQVLTPLCSAQSSWDALSELGELVTPKSRNRADFIEECKSGKLNGVLVTYRTFNSVDITGKFDEELVPLLPESLKFICHNGKDFLLSMLSFLFRLWAIDLLSLKTFIKRLSFYPLRHQCLISKSNISMFKSTSSFERPDCQLIKFGDFLASVHNKKPNNFIQVRDMIKSMSTPAQNAASEYPTSHKP